MKHSSPTILCFFAILVTVPSLAWATVLIEYDIAGYPNAGATTLAPSIYDSRLLLNDEVIPEPLTMEGAAPMNAGIAGLYFARGWTVTPEKNPTQYFEFRLIVLPDYNAQLDRLTYSLGRENWGGNQGANGWELHASYDQFDKSDILLETVDSSAVADYFVPGADTALTIETDLSILDGTQRTINFRWYGYGGTGNYASGFIHQGGFGSNVTLEGELTAVPEPGTLAFLAFGTLVLLFHRRGHHTRHHLVV